MNEKFFCKIEQKYGVRVNKENDRRFQGQRKDLTWKKS